VLIYPQVLKRDSSSAVRAGNRLSSVEGWQNRGTGATPLSTRWARELRPADRGESGRSSAGDDPEAMDSLLTSQFKLWGRSVALGRWRRAKFRTSPPISFVCQVEGGSTRAEPGMDRTSTCGKPETKPTMARRNPRDIIVKHSVGNQGGGPAEEEVEEGEIGQVAFFPITGRKGHRCAGGPFFPE